ncbi:1313_t:CDS:2 [Funneliformis geosporum]|uniref:1313_t:CDS:1 n=1 Tax=Funneliformis geosporum TaxID=1117311 RepID=A0A9W4S9J1_9GLOM|nr:1313_t:CDS:2 [Funneliformis geosporum]
MSVKIDIPPKNKKVSICPTIRGRIISPDDKKYWDGYFRMEDLKLLATKKGSLSPSKTASLMIRVRFPLLAPLTGGYGEVVNAPVCGTGIPSNNIVLEPFAGSNNLIKMLQNEGCDFNFVSYDINPNSPENSAHRKKIEFPTTKYDDLYKLCLEIMLKNCDYVGAIIPASFINADLFLERLHSYTLLSSQMFTDTENPVCLVLFSPQKTNSIYLYENDKHFGELYSLKKQVEQILTNNKSQPTSINFNHKKGNLGLRAIDGTRFPSIAFIEASQVPENKIKVSSRHLTRIHIPQQVNLSLLNKKLKELREITNDFFLTPFRGLRKDGKFRRRLDFQLAKKIIKSSKNIALKLKNDAKNMDPKKQNIYEILLAQYISSLKFVSDFQKLNNGGKNALYIDRGVIRKGNEYPHDKPAKSYIEENGGAQDNQFNEIKKCIEVSRNGSQEPNRRVIFVCDGVLLREEQQKDQELLRLLTTKQIPYQLLSKENFSRYSFDKKNQGIVAFIHSYNYVSLSSLLSQPPQRKIPLIVMLDSIEDPHNFGAILRTCAALKVDGIIIAKKNQVPVNSTVVKVSVGGVAYVPVCQVSNLGEVVNELRKKDYQIISAVCEPDSQAYGKFNFDFPTCLIFGNEHEGIRKNLIKKSDFSLYIPMGNNMASLNVSVSCGIILAHAILHSGRKEEN